MILRRAIGDDLQAEYLSGALSDVLRVPMPRVVINAHPGDCEAAGFASIDEARECLRRVVNGDDIQPSSDGIYDISPEGGSGYVQAWAEERDGAILLAEVVS